MVRRHYRGEAEREVYYRIPKMLFENPRYENISTLAKVLYGLMLDRMGLSATRERWMDKDGSVFIYFQQTEAMRLLKVKGAEKIVKLYKELEEAELIERVKQGFGKPEKIYVGYVEIYDSDITATKDAENPQSFENRNSAFSDPTRLSKIETQTFENRKSRPSKIEGLPSNIYGVISTGVTSINPAQAQHTETGANPEAAQPPKEAINQAGATDQTSDKDKDAKNERLIITAEAPSEPYKGIFRRQLLAENLEKEFGWQETDELINALAEECAATTKTMRVGGRKSFPRHWFRKEVMLMEPEHARRILYALRQIDPAKIHNRRAYLITMCYNHKTTNWTPDEYDPGDPVPRYTKEELANMRKANMRKQEIAAKTK